MRTAETNHALRTLGFAARMEALGMRPARRKATDGTPEAI
jgi:hypothetical protein